LIPINRKSIQALKFNGLNVIYKYKRFRLDVHEWPVKDLFHIKRSKDAIAEQAADCKVFSEAWNVSPFIE